MDNLIDIQEPQDDDEPIKKKPKTKRKKTPVHAFVEAPTLYRLRSALRGTVNLPRGAIGPLSELDSDTIKLLIAKECLTLLDKHSIDKLNATRRYKAAFAKAGYINLATLLTMTPDELAKGLDMSVGRVRLIQQHAQQEYEDLLND